MPALTFANVLPFLVAFAILFGLTLLFRTTEIDGPLRRAYVRLSQFLLARGVFTAPLEAEATKIDLLRIAAGLRFVQRTWHTATHVFGGNDSPSYWIVCVLALLLGTLFTIGLFTPIVSLLLLFGNILIIDKIFSTFTLGKPPPVKRVREVDTIRDVPRESLALAPGMWQEFGLAVRANRSLCRTSWQRTAE